MQGQEGEEGEDEGVGAVEEAGGGSQQQRQRRRGHRCPPAWSTGAARAGRGLPLNQEAAPVPCHGMGLTARLARQQGGSKWVVPARPSTNPIDVRIHQPVCQSIAFYRSKAPGLGLPI